MISKYKIESLRKELKSIGINKVRSVFFVYRENDECIVKKEGTQEIVFQGDKGAFEEYRKNPIFSKSIFFIRGNPDWMEKEKLERRLQRA